MSARSDVRQHANPPTTPPDHALNLAIARIQLADLADVSRYPNPRGAIVGDAQAAFALYEQECIRAHNIASDGLVARQLQARYDQGRRPPPHLSIIYAHILAEAAQAVRRAPDRHVRRVEQRNAAAPRVAEIRIPLTTNQASSPVQVPEVRPTEKYVTIASVGPI